MKRHYEIMRIMRTKVVKFRELYEGADGILYVQDAIQYRVKNLASASVLSTYAACRINLIHPSSDNFSQRRLDPEKEFESFSYGIVGHFFVSWTALPSDVSCLQFKYFHNGGKTLWTVDYVRGLRQEVIPYNDDEDVQPRVILNYGYKDELSVDNGMYDGHSVDDISGHGDVEPPLKDMYVLTFICINHIC
jgi:hypothetical protein